MMKTAPEKPAPKKPALWLRIVLSVFIVYHLIVISVLANGSSFLGRRLDPWISFYGNLLGLNVAWNFFAPDPAHTMFIHYTVRFDGKEGEEPRDSVEGYIPPEKEKIVIDTSKRRFLYAMRFLVFDERRMKILLGPFLCRQHPGAHAVHLENILEPIPSLDVSQLENQREKQQSIFMEYTHYCNEAQDEVAL